MSSTGRRRALTKRETRAALLDAGLAEFAAHGLDTPSLDAICARAGFTRGAFYVHFRDREDFVVAVMERELATFLDVVIATGDRAYDLEHTITRFADALEPALTIRRGRRQTPTPLAGGVQLHRLLEACARSTAIRGRVVGLIQQAVGRLSQVAAAGQAERTVRRDVESGQVATLLVMLAIGLLTAAEIGMPLDSAAGRETVLALLGAPRRAGSR
jgi:TetR/AcrR family transcriptional repressor of nem operon